MHIPDHVRSVIDPDGAVLLDLRSGKYYSLDDVAAEIWTQLEAGAPVRAIEARLCERYDVSSATAREDVRNLVDQLGHMGLIDVDRDA